MIFTVVVVNVLVYLITCAFSSPTDIKNYPHQRCHSDKDCLETQYCSENLNCIECFNCSTSERSKFLSCAKKPQDCSPCLHGYIEIFIKNSRTQMPCLPPPVSFDQVLQLTNNPTSYSVVLTPTKVLMDLHDRGIRQIIQLTSDDTRICNTDEDCPESQYCFDELACIKCFDCSEFKRSNILKCTKYSTDCGPCLPEYMEIGPNPSPGASCMRWNSMLESVWSQGQLFND